MRRVSKRVPSCDGPLILAHPRVSLPSARNATLRGYPTAERGGQKRGGFRTAWRVAVAKKWRKCMGIEHSRQSREIGQFAKKSVQNPVHSAHGTPWTTAWRWLWTLGQRCPRLPRRQSWQWSGTPKGEPHEPLAASRLSARGFPMSTTSTSTVFAETPNWRGFRRRPPPVKRPNKPQTPRRRENVSLD